MGIRAQLSRLVSIVSTAHRFDWVVDGLAVGTDSVPPHILGSNGINSVLSVGAKLPYTYAADAMYLDVVDGEPPSEDDAVRAVKWIGQRLGASKKVFVHCHAGMGRSVTIAACYLIATGSTVEEALKTLRQRHPQSSPTRSQVDFLRRFESKYRGLLISKVGPDGQK